HHVNSIESGCDVVGRKRKTTEGLELSGPRLGAIEGGVSGAVDGDWLVEQKPAPQMGRERHTSRLTSLREHPSRNADALSEGFDPQSTFNAPAICPQKMTRNDMRWSCASRLFSSLGGARRQGSPRRIRQRNAESQ